MMLLNAPRVPEVFVTDPRRGWHHLEALVLRGSKYDIVQTMQRSDIIYQVTTADQTPLCVVVPGPKYHELDERLRRFRNLKSAR